MADITLKSYSESGGTPPGGSKTVYLDIVQSATPRDGPEIKNLNPLYASGPGYSVYMRDKGRAWDLSGLNNAHQLTDLADGLKWLWKVQAINSNLPPGIQELSGKYLRIEAIARPVRVDTDLIEWQISAREVKPL